MSETLSTPSPLQLRAEPEKMVRPDLLGPAGGPHEVDERNVRDRYIVGLLAPKGQTFIPEEEEEDTAVGGADVGQGGKMDRASLPTASMLPSFTGS
jgi:hypothetical protein